MATKKPAPLKDALADWAAEQDPVAVQRLLKRIQRFAGNTTSEATSLAASSLADMIDNRIKERTPMGETDE